MADQLESIVQRMMDAGEPEDNIATVIQHFKAQNTITQPTTADLLAGRMLNQDEPQTTLVGKTAQAIEPLAHPTTVGDVASLMLPTMVPSLVGAAKDYYTAGKQAFSEAPSLRKVPGTMFGILKRRAFPEPPPPPTPFNELPLYKQMEQLPETPAPVTTRFPEPPMRGTLKSVAASAPEPAATSSGLSEADRASLMKRYGSEATQGILRRLEQADVAPAVSHEPSSPLREPRVNIGAEKVGRAEGLTKEQVRQQTGPILGEQPGEASPILPKDAIGRMIETMKPMNAAEREAYVQRATSGKAQWQIENLRRTLEHLGLLVPIAATIGQTDRPGAQ